MNTLSLLTFVADNKLNVKKLKVRVIFLLLGLLLGPHWVAASTEQPANHYIILMDASGSIKIDNINKINNYRYESMADATPIVKALIDKSLQSMPKDPNFPAPKETDLYSFAYFSLDYHQPSYDPSDMFLSNILKVGAAGIKPHCKQD